MSSLPSQAGKTSNTMAYLGPPGTYGHQAAGAFVEALSLEQRMDLIPCPDITSIFRHEADYLVMPLQNTIHGPVLETVDAMIASSERDQPTPIIIGELHLPIRHCLVAPTGTRMDDVRWVRSHEQALGQSSRFLAEHLPQAKLHQWPSTAGAAVSLLEGPPGDGPGAAICSKAVVALYPDRLQVLYDGTQGIDNNFTRFLLFTKGKDYARVYEKLHNRPDASDFFVFEDIRGVQEVLNDRRSLRAIHGRPGAATAGDPTVTSREDDGDRDEEEERIVANPYPLRYLMETTKSELSSEAPLTDDRYLGRTTLLASLEKGRTQSDGQ